MAHRLVFSDKGNTVTIHESHSESELWNWSSVSSRHIVVYKGADERTYSVREWLTLTECRATVTHAQRSI